MAYFGDRVKDTTTTVGTGAIVLANVAPTGYQTLATALGSESRQVTLCIELGAEWEVVQGIFNGTTGFTRDTVFDSSNAGALVNFSAGTKNVFLTYPADYVQSLGSDVAFVSSNYGI